VENDVKSTPVVNPKRRKRKAKQSKGRPRLPDIDPSWEHSSANGITTLHHTVGSKDNVYKVPDHNAKRAAKLLHPDGLGELMKGGQKYCRCPRGCCQAFTVGALQARRLAYVQHASEARASKWIVQQLRTMRSGEEWTYYMPTGNGKEREVCSRFWHVATGFSESKLKVARDRARYGGEPNFTHGNRGKTYATAKNARRICKAFWLQFYDTRCQKPNDDMWLSPSQLTQRKYS
jgi:hypothetical protein